MFSNTIYPHRYQTATVEAGENGLPLRASPAINAPVVGNVPDGGKLVILRRLNEWFAVRGGDIEGYAPCENLVLHF